MSGIRSDLRLLLWLQGLNLAGSVAILVLVFLRP